MKCILESVGYDGLWYEKPKGSCNTGNNGLCNDGVAIFWNTSRIERTERPVDEFNMDKKQVALFIPFRLIASKKEFIVGSAHLKSGKAFKACKIKRDHMKKFAKHISEEYGDVPLIFAADLNTSYDSGAFKLFYDGKCGKEEWTKKGKVDTLPPDTLGATTPAGDFLESAYDFVKNNKEGVDSNRNSALKFRKGGEQASKRNVLDDHTIDYIFHSKDHWKVLQRLSIPTFKEVNEGTGGEDFEGPYNKSKRDVLGQLLPHWKYPSDHFMIGADIELL